MLEPSGKSVLCKKKIDSDSMKSGLYMTDQLDSIIYEIVEVGYKVNKYSKGDKVIVSGGHGLTFNGEQYISVDEQLILVKVK